MKKEYLQVCGVFFIILGVLIFLGAGAFFYYAFALGAGMNTTGCDAHCTPEFSDLFIKEAFILFWVPALFGVVVAFIGYRITNKKR